MQDVCRALAPRSRGALAGDLPIRGSIQAISNALRHARRYGWVESEQVGKANRSVWRLTKSGRIALTSAERGGVL